MRSTGDSRVLLIGREGGAGGLSHSMMGFGVVEKDELKLEETSDG